MRLTIIRDDLVFPECPRWRDGTLWVSDCHDGRVVQLTAQGELRGSFGVPGGPAGLGWLPDGDMLLVSIAGLCVYRRRRDGTIDRHADLTPHHRHHANDMVVDASGNAYVGEVGFRPDEPARTTSLLRVTPDGTVSVAATDMMTPNGSVITHDGRTLIVAESRAHRLLAFTIGSNGALNDRRVFADLDTGQVPDGICLDAEGCVWVASPRARAVLRVSASAGVVAVIPVETGRPYACMLGEDDRRTLFVCLAKTHDPAEARRMRRGAIASMRVPVAGAGRP